MRDVVLPNLGVFGPLVYLVELLIGVSLLLGLFSRAGATLGLLMGINLWLGPLARRVGGSIVSSNGCGQKHQEENTGQATTNHGLTPTNAFRHSEVGTVTTRA